MAKRQEFSTLEKKWKKLNRPKGKLDVCGDGGGEGEGEGGEGVLVAGR